MTTERSKSRGRFITLEGIEGVGKSTNLRFVADYIRRAGKDVVLTREPGGVPVAERIRAILLANDDRHLPPMTELLLMFAARAAHLNELIWPALDRGQWVVCDRFTDASYAYQGGGRGLSAAAIADLEVMVQGNFRPDLTLLLDADWTATRDRRIRRAVQDRFEREDGDFFDRVRAGYLERARIEPMRFRVIDASRSVDEVQAEAAVVLGRVLSAWSSAT